MQIQTVDTTFEYLYQTVHISMRAVLVSDNYPACPSITQLPLHKYLLMTHMLAVADVQIYFVFSEQSERL